MDCYAAIEAWRLLYIKNHHSTLRAELYSGLQDAIAAGKNDAHVVEKRLVLAASLTGGPCYINIFLTQWPSAIKWVIRTFYHIHPQSYLAKNPSSSTTTTRSVCQLLTRHCCSSISLKAKKAKMKLQREKSLQQSHCR